MLNVISEAISPMTATRAIIIYGQGQALVRHATIHDVRLDEHGTPVLEAGTGLRDETLLDLLQSLLGASPLSYLPSNMLARTKDIKVWWTPPVLRTLFIKPVETTGQNYDKLPTHNWIVPVPGLVFTIHNRSLSVCAVQGRERPKLSTPLYRAPFANTYDTGTVCMGDVQLGMDTDEIEKQFFDSVFTHDVGAVKRVKNFSKSWKAWETLVGDRAINTFPPAWLLHTNTTLEGFLKRGAKL